MTPMFFNWRGVTIVLGVIAAVIALCALDLRCSGSASDIPTVARVKGELAAGKREMRILQAEELANLARDMRVLAKRYIAKGDKKKAQRAIGAAQELDRKIRELRGEE